MFICKQLKNFVYIKSVYSAFDDCIFKVTHANSIQISFPIFEISLKCVAHLKGNLLCSRLNVKDFLLKCRQIVYCVAIAFTGKLLITQFCKVCNCLFCSNFFSVKCFELKLLLNLVVIFLKINYSAKFSYQKN